MIYDCRNRIKLLIAFSNFENLIYNSRNRIKSSIVFFNSKNNNLNNLLNIVELDKVKTKKQFRKSQNKKNLITKIDKKAANFTKRNFFKFEHVKRKLKIKAKRVKKNIIVNKKITITKKIIVAKKIIDQTTKNRKNQSKNKAFTTAILQFIILIITQSNAILLKFIKLFSNIEFNNKKFNVSKQSDEIAKND